MYAILLLVDAFEKAPSLQDTLNATKKLGKLPAYELLVLKELIALLKPIKQATDDFQTNFKSNGNVIPAFLGLKTALRLFTFCVILALFYASH